MLDAGTRDDTRVKGLVTIGSPVNFKKRGMITTGSTLGAPGMDRAIDLLGNVPGVVSSVGFKLLDDPKRLKRYWDLLWNLHVENHVRGFMAINHWTNDMIPYPKEAFRQMFRDVVYENRLWRNKLVFGSQTCDLKRFSCRLLAMAGHSDTIATPASTRDLVDLVSSTDKTFIEVPGGHVAWVAGSNAPKEIWEPITDWLSSRMVQSALSSSVCRPGGCRAS